MFGPFRVCVSHRQPAPAGLAPARPGWRGPRSFFRVLQPAVVNLPGERNPTGSRRFFGGAAGFSHTGRINSTLAGEGGVVGEGWMQRNPTQNSTFHPTWDLPAPRSPFSACTPPSPTPYPTPPKKTSHLHHRPVPAHLPSHPLHLPLSLHPSICTPFLCGMLSSLHWARSIDLLP